MRMSDSVFQFTHLVSKAKKLELAYFHIIEARISGNTNNGRTDSNDFVFKAWGTSVAEVAVAFGRNFLANPDLPYRISQGLELNAYNWNTFYGAESPVGYIDYPFSQDRLAAQA